MNKNFMNESNQESVNAGSSVEKKVDPNNLDAGQSTQKTSEDMIPKSQYTELEKKLGEMGNEKGELKKAVEKYEEWFDDTKPLWEKLESQPELVKAITEGKIDSTLVQAVIDGKFSIKEAEKVTEAHEKVKEELGEKKYENMSPEQINKLIETEVKKATAGVDEKVKKTLEDDKAMKDYEDKVKEFVRNTKDFDEYAIEVNKYLELHPTLGDIEIAYNAVKGIRLQKEKEADAEKQKAEAAKNFATNVSGGSGQSSTIIKDPDEAAKYISPIANPNRLR